MYASDSTFAYSPSEESHLRLKSARRKAVVVGGSAIEFNAYVSHVHAAKMLEEVGPTSTKVMKRIRGSDFCMLRPREISQPRMETMTIGVSGPIPRRRTRL